MATSTINPASSSSTASGQSNLYKIGIPYAIAIGAQLPMLLLYFRDLWARAHYQFFPFAIFATVAFAFIRWPRDLASPFHRSLISNVMLGIGLFCGLITVVFQAPWFAALSVMMLVASLLIRTTDGETLGSLGIVALPLFTCLILPLRFDTRLIVTLQRVSSSITSALLDLIGLKHHNIGTIIQVPGTQGYGIEEACSGVQSFFTLFFFASVLIVYFRRTFIRSILLLAASVFWAIFMNTVRIVSIPIAQEFAGIDLVHGVKHDLLGYCVLVMGILLLFSTDQLIQAVLGPQDPEGGIAALASQAISGKKKQKGKRRSISKLTQGFLWSTAGVLALCGVAQLFQVGSALADPTTKINFFDPNVTVAFEEGDVPTEVANWRKVDFRSELRDRSADLGLRTDAWQFRAPRCAANLSFDQTFPGWHELTTCYKNAGWELIQRNKVGSLPASPNGPDWPYIEATFKKKTGEYGYLLFSLFDAKGVSIEPPSSWGGLGSILIRLRGRMTHKLRASLFQSEAYQTQVFIQSYSPLNDDLKTEIRDRYFVLRESIRQRFLQKQGIVEEAKPADGSAPVNQRTLPAAASGGGLEGSSDESGFPF